MNPRPTKQLREGMLVTYKRGWIVPCGPKDQLRGVWRKAGLMLFADGYKCAWPAGVQIRGDAVVAHAQTNT
jgi:hypothetical protein